MKRFVITGGSGFLGLNLVGLLLKTYKNVNIVIIDRSKNSVFKDHPNISVINKSILDLTTDDLNLQNVDGIFLLAGLSGTDVSPKDLDINVQANENIINIAKSQNSYARIIFPSSQLVYQKSSTNKTETSTDFTSNNEYVASKLSCEQMIINSIHNDSKLSYTIFRISNPYGPHIPKKQTYNYANQLLMRLINNEKITLIQKGEIMKNFIPVQNVVKIFHKITLDKLFENEVINLGHFENIIMNDFYQSAVEIFNSGKVSFVNEKLVDTSIPFNTDKLYSQINKKELLSTKEALKSTFEFFRNAENTISLNDFLDVY